MKRKYEIGLIINPEATEDEVKKIIDTIAGIIDKAKGSIENIDEWGRRKLAFPIGKHKEGNYVFINTDVVGAAFINIERRLKLSEKVLRFVILRLDDKLKKANKLTKKWKRVEKISKRSQEVKADTMDNEKPENREVNNEK
jgi:small subunit ribosomal protein S6